jgi:hypothetical protein
MIGIGEGYITRATKIIKKICMENNAKSAGGGGFGLQKPSRVANIPASKPPLAVYPNKIN